MVPPKLVTVLPVLPLLWLALALCRGDHRLLKAPARMYCHDSGSLVLTPSFVRSIHSLFQSFKEVLSHIPRSSRYSETGDCCFKSSSWLVWRAVEVEARDAKDCGDEDSLVSN